MLANDPGEGRRGRTARGRAAGGPAEKRFVRAHPSFDGRNASTIAAATATTLRVNDLTILSGFMSTSSGEAPADGAVVNDEGETTDPQLTPG